MFYQLVNLIVNVSTFAIVGYGVGLHFQLFAKINSAFMQVVSMFPF